MRDPFFLSSSLLVSLSVCPVHAVLPGKGDVPDTSNIAILAALGAFGHQALNSNNVAIPENPQQQMEPHQQPVAESTAVRPNLPADALEYIRSLEVNTLPFEDSEYQANQNQEPVPEGATAVDSNDAASPSTHSSSRSDSLNFLIEANRFWQQSHRQLVAPLSSSDRANRDRMGGGNDVLDGVFDRFPDTEQVNPWLQSVNDFTALDSIVENFAQYSLIDLHYVLWRIAHNIGSRGLMRTLVLNTNLLSRSFMRDLITFDQLSGEFIGREALLSRLNDLRIAVSISANAGNAAQLLPGIVNSHLYNAIRLYALEQYKNALANPGGRPNIGQLLVFIRHLSENVASTFDGQNYLEGNREAYARSRALFWLFHLFDGVREFSREESRYINSAYRSFTALYMTFMGDTSRAHEILRTVADGEVTFPRGEDSQEVSSLINRVVDGNMDMLSTLGLQYYRPDVYHSLYFLMRMPFSGQTPHTIVNSGSLDVLRSIREALAFHLDSLPVLSDSNEILTAHITDIARFELGVLQGIEARQKNSRLALENKRLEIKYAYDKKHSKKRNLLNVIKKTMEPRKQ
ncbi:hypothetical protein [Endozoicomonas lisbonensis]|uniref:Uncharacterized protein n=1 Tax=Endozoicomonas lisbonensis TaxID=3120522 RepID=A0ABV2SDR2_9GAMM